MTIVNAPLHANRLLLTHNLADALYQLRERYGDVIRLPLRRVYFVSDPDIIMHATQTNWRNYRKSAAMDRATALLGNGLLTNHGESWLSQRRLMAPSFHMRQIGLLADAMIDEIEQMLVRWEGLRKRGPIDISAEFNALTMRIATRCLFSSQIDPTASQRVADNLTYLLKLFQQRTILPIPRIDTLPLPSNRRAEAAIAELDALVYGIIAARRRSAAPYDDLLSLLIDARDEATGAQMDDKQLRDEVMTLFLAGFETTASHLAWTTLLLHQHPAEADALAVERQHVLNGMPVSAESIRQLPRLKRVMDESLRLYPPGWLFGRTAVASDNAAGLALEAGDTLLMSSYVVHRHPHWWPDADQFRPNRWLEVGVPRHRFAYWPFGGGPRQCIGNQFALLEAALTLTLIGQRYRLRIVSDQKVVMRPSMTLRPKYNLLAYADPV